MSDPVQSALQEIERVGWHAIDAQKPVLDHWKSKADLLRDIGAYFDKMVAQDLDLSLIHI